MYGAAPCHPPTVSRPMTIVADNELAGINDAIGCRRWLAALPEDSLERLSAIGRLLVRLGRPDLPVDATIAILEPTRVALIRAVDGCLAEVAGRPLPYGAEAWRSVGDSLTTLRAMRTLYKRAGSRISREIQARVAGVEPGPGTTGSSTLPIAPVYASPQTVGATVATIELPASTTMGAEMSDGASRAALPLLRALDVQSRVVAALLAHHVEPLPEDWDELCLLARHARAAGLLDAKIPDVLPLVRPVTARALFVYPLLLRLAGLSHRSRTEAALAERLASRLAGQVGLRIDSGVSKKNPYGPTLALTPVSSVRLDTHRIPGGLEKRRQQWSEAAASAAAGAPAQVSGESLIALIDDLYRCWAPPAAGETASAGAMSAAPAANAELRANPGERGGAGGAVSAPGSSLLAFGLPRRRDAQGGERRGGPYEYGQWEQNTILRVSRVARVGGRSPAPAWDPLAGAEAVQTLSQAGDRLLVERRQVLPSASAGALVALRATHAGPAEDRAPAGAGAAASEAESPSPTQAQPQPIRLGTVKAVAQMPEPGYARIGAHRLEVELWPGQARPVGLRQGTSKSFDDAWLLAPAGESMQPSLLVAPGLAAPGARLTMRAADREQGLRLTNLLGRGPGYERYGFAADRVDGADAR